MSPEIVKPFNLAEGYYVVGHGCGLMGPLIKCFNDAGAPYFVSPNDGVDAYWHQNGAPSLGDPSRKGIRISSVITGPVGMLAYIDRMSLSDDEFARQQVEIARAALATMIRKDDPDFEEPVKAIEAEPVGEAAERVLEVMLRDIIREEMRAIIREEIPAIVAESCNQFDGSELRLAVSVAPLRA